MNIRDIGMCFLLSAIAGTGVGGGGLFMIYLTGPMGFSQLPAQAVNLFYFMAAAVPSVLTRFRTLPFRLTGLCIAGGIPGVILGSYVRNLLPEEMLAKIFGILLAASGAAVFFIRERKEKKPQNSDFFKTE
ncbi:MAG: sulfite exporter TauE/SafE family protein [Ruminococcaceae bacterium]|nr:sulfite exporter TauE/SafE family protein [Oscillospiraceae bacterium]